MLLLIFLYMAVAFAEYFEKTCPESLDCTWKYPYYVTQNFECLLHEQCSEGLLCCRDCHYSHKVCKEASIKEFQCPESKFCKQKYPLTGTQKFECTIDKQCEWGYLCCEDLCYSHKICKKAVEVVEDDECPNQSFKCSLPRPYEETINYKCIRHSQCKSNHVCCADSCYNHQVCKLKPSEDCPISIRKELCSNTNRTSKYFCKKQKDCYFGYICCEDNCYNHKVCKLPLGAFDYRYIYRSNPIRHEENGCPIVDTCVKPYSLRLAKKLICSRDEDCNSGQLCCKDSCVKDFKICTNTAGYERAWM